MRQAPDSLLGCAGVDRVLGHQLEAYASGSPPSTEELADIELRLVCSRWSRRACSIASSMTCFEVRKNVFYR